MYIHTKNAFDTIFFIFVMNDDNYVSSGFRNFGEGRRQETWNTSRRTQQLRPPLPPPPPPPGSFSVLDVFWGLFTKQEAKRLFADRNIKRRCVPSLRKSHIAGIWGTMWPHIPHIYIPYKEVREYQWPIKSMIVIGSNTFNNGHSSFTTIDLLYMVINSNYSNTFDNGPSCFTEDVHASLKTSSSFWNNDRMGRSL